MRKEEGHKRSTNEGYSFTSRNDQVKIDVLILRREVSAQLLCYFFLFCSNFLSKLFPKFFGQTFFCQNFLSKFFCRIFSKIFLLKLFCQILSKIFLSNFFCNFFHMISMQLDCLIGFSCQNHQQNKNIPKYLLLES